MRFFLLSIISVSFLLSHAAYADDIQTSAKQFVLIDVATRTVLADKNSQQRMPTSSMSKVITLYEVFQALKDGRIQLTDEFPVSEKAWRMGGSKMFVEVGKTVSVENLIRGVAVQSGNDATVVLAEGLAGTEDAFAEQLNKRAKELDMENSHFVNASGWPDPDHYSTAYDLALLAYRIEMDFPEYYKYFGEKEFTYNDITQPNRNPLLYRNIGADGIKTGHTEIAGYGLMASAKQADRRVILVANGMDSTKQRSSESARLLSMGFSDFDTLPLFKSGETVETAKVWLGQQATVPLIIDQNVSAIYKKSEKDSIDVRVQLDEPVAAPIIEGQEIGTLTVKMGDFPTKTYPLKAGDSVPEIGMMGRMIQRAKSIVLGTGE